MKRVARTVSTVVMGLSIAVIAHGVMVARYARADPGIACGSVVWSYPEGYYCFQQVECSLLMKCKGPKVLAATCNCKF